MGKKRRLNQLIFKWIKSDQGKTPLALILKPSRRPLEAQKTSIDDHPIRQAECPRRCLVTTENGERSAPTVVVNLTNVRLKIEDMEASVDSIGTCSLDMEASRETTAPDWSDAGSTVTLRGSSSTDQPPLPHLPSYLSLACTVNGYSTTTNYDPVRLTRSRDASPHRLDCSTTAHHLRAPDPKTYSVTNNLLSPPNLVPLPQTEIKKTMSAENAFKSPPKVYYSYTKTITFVSDRTDAAALSYNNTISKTEYTNGTETKSFIQQRVERLYGPGALAQGFFVSKRQSEVADRLNKTLPDKLEEEAKPSSRSPSLPVLRHLRPEFRAQLPLASPRKVIESQIAKIGTVPELIEVKVNGCGAKGKATTIHTNGNGHVPQEIGGEKDGHYFIKILEEQSVRLLALAERTEKELGSLSDLSEDVVGKLRSASGKAKLLVSQKMQQFRGLCKNNISQSTEEQFPITNEDLQGFWDMVMLQVDQVDRLFEEIDKLRQNNWKELEMDHCEANKVIGGGAKSKPVRKAISKPKLSAANEETRKQREEQRKKMIEERRKAMKAAQQSQQPSVEIFFSETS